MIRKYAEIFCWKNVSSFCSAKATHIFSAKNIRILCIESAKTVNEMTLNDVVKLTTLWTTGPSFLKWWLPWQHFLDIFLLSQSIFIITVDSRYRQETFWNTSRYPYLDISELQNWEKNNQTTTFHEWICNLTPEVKLYWKKMWKRGETAPNSIKEKCGKEEKLLQIP